MIVLQSLKRNIGTKEFSNHLKYDKCLSSTATELTGKFQNNTDILTTNLVDFQFHKKKTS